MENKRKYRYDLHVHTKESSACAHSTAAEMVDMYKSEGYDGIVITDHFHTGNTSVKRTLEWTEWVTTYVKSYKNGKARGDEIGLDVFFGWEYSYAGTDFLTFGLDEEWLLAHPELRTMNVYDYLNLVHQDGGMIIHAHPFLEAGYVPCIRLMPPYEDGVEILNASKSDFMNDRAAEYAKAYDKIVTGGSDSHNVNWPRLSGIEVDHRLTSITDLIETLKKREHMIFQIVRNLDK